LFRNKHLKIENTKKGLIKFMANEQNQNTQDTNSNTDFGGEQNLNSGLGQSFGSGTSARQAKMDDTSSFGNQESSGNSPVETVKETAKSLFDQAKGSAGQAYGLATEKATTKLEEQKTNLAGGLTSVADSLKQVGETLRDTDEQNPITEFTAKYGDTLAEQIEKVGSYFENKDVREMVRDVESFARRNPAVFIGAAFGLGLLAARFLKSSSPKQLTQGTGESFNNKTQTAVNPS
jgi:ElaB/YqjD/DUF883 family membrane-anchored ribosome-binding protein